MGFQPTPYGHPCRPPFYARGGHLQTILAHLIPTPAPSLVAGLDGVRSVDIPLPDGDALRAFYRAGSSGVLVAIFHGLSGDSNSDYMRLTAQVAQTAGHAVLSVNHRGCGAGRGLARGLYHSGRGDDVGEALTWARRELPELTQIAVGYSLSGNALLLALAASAAGGLQGPDGAIAVNPPIDLRECSKRISSGLNKLYDKRFVRRCLGAVRERQADNLLPPGFHVPRPKTLWEFDEQITAPLSGFLGAEDYYRRCSSKDLLHTISSPTVIIHAQDDPFVTAQSYAETQLSRQCHLHLEPHGGHVGYLTGTARAPQKWLGGALSHYVVEVCAAVQAATVGD
jgi:predicted alpha/beta-fold hydrolase